MNLQKILCLDDFESAAAKHLPRPIFGYIAGAAETNQSYDANRQAFQDYSFVPRVMVDVSKRSLTQSLLGQSFDAPFGIAPMGISALYAYRGDVVLAKTAAACNLPAIMSGSSLIKMEDVAAAAPRTWFQAYLPGTMEAITALIDRVRAAGFQTLVITADTPVSANRENNVRTGFSTPLRPTPSLAWQGITHPHWLIGTFARTLVQHGLPHFENNYAHRGAPILSNNVMRDFAARGHLNWDYLKRIRDMWHGHLIVKGILSAQDARIAADMGIDGIIVSNHGGRQLDGAVAPLAVLPQIVQACPNIPVMLDSGVRRGSDVLKALALGASFVFIGRPFAYAASIAGEAGVHKAIDLLTQEISRNMAMLGVISLDQLDSEFVVRQ